jgi:hypothetical protein
MPFPEKNIDDGGLEKILNTLPLHGLCNRSKNTSKETRKSSIFNGQRK